MLDRESTVRPLRPKGGRPPTASRHDLLRVVANGLRWADEHGRTRDELGIYVQKMMGLDYPPAPSTLRKWIGICRALADTPASVDKARD